jgi:hypothetical protein
MAISLVIIEVFSIPRDFGLLKSQFRPQDNEGGLLDSTGKVRITL